MTAPPAIAPELLQRFFAAVLINDVVDDGLVPPTRLPLARDGAELAACAALAQGSWAAGFDRAGLAAVATAALAGAAVDADGLRRLKQVRAKFKQLRFAHALYGRAHRYPRLVNQATIAMGELQDALRHGRSGAVRGWALVLRAMMAAPVAALLRAQARRLRLDSPAGFRRHLDGELAALGRVLAEPAVAGRAFHAARKVVSRHNAFWTALDVLHPAPDHHRLARWLSAVNGEMGRLHDALVAARAADPASYDAPFVLPPGIRDRIALLLALPRD